MSVIAFDLDDVICSRTSDEGPVEKYKTCYPHQDMVDLVNNCYDKGHTIIIYTARGMTGFQGDVDKIYDNLFDLTQNDLDKWGVKFHKLIMGKAHYDILIDDKAMNSLRVKEITDIEDFLEKK